MYVFVYYFVFIQNFTWAASISLVGLSKCNANGTLNSSVASVIFNTNTGIATFQNLEISQKGMYMLIVDVKTTNTNKYNFVCFSTPILVKAKTETILTSSQDTEPNIYLTFTGNYTSQTADTLKEIQTMIYNCLMVQYGLLIESPIQLYQGSIKGVFDSSGSASSYSSLLTALNDNTTNFTLTSDVILQYATINGKSIVKFQSSSSQNQISDTAQANEDNNAVNNIYLKSIFIKQNSSS